MVDDALTMSERTGQHWHDAELHHVRGDTTFVHAIEIARPSAHEELRTARRDEHVAALA
jgi:hypothetical protein